MSKPQELSFSIYLLATLGALNVAIWAAQLIMMAVA